MPAVNMTGGYCSILASCRAVISLFPVKLNVRKIFLFITLSGVTSLRHLLVPGIEHSHHLVIYLSVQLLTIVDSNVVAFSLFHHL